MSDIDDDLIEAPRAEQLEFSIPLHQSLIQTILLVGMPREVAIITMTIAAAITLGLQVWQVGVPVGFMMVSIFALLTKLDPLWWDVIRRHIAQPKYLDV